MRYEMSQNDEKAHIIIHGAAASAAAVGAGLAQIPGSDNAIIVPIQVAMIIAIGAVYGRNLNEAAALSILSAASAGIIGRTISQFVIGWFPGIGNAINAGTAAAVTEAIGWSAYNILSKQQTEQDSDHILLPTIL